MRWFHKSCFHQFWVIYLLFHLLFYFGFSNKNKWLFKLLFLYILFLKQNSILWGDFKKSSNFGEKNPDCWKQDWWNHLMSRSQGTNYAHHLGLSPLNLKTFHQACYNILGIHTILPSTGKDSFFCYPGHAFVFHCASLLRGGM